MSLLMKFRPQYLGCTIMSATGIFRALEEPSGCSLLLPSITEYSLLLREIQKHTQQTVFYTTHLPPPRTFSCP